MHQCMQRLDKSCQERSHWNDPLRLSQFNPQRILILLTLQCTGSDLVFIRYVLRRWGRSSIWATLCTKIRFMFYLALSSSACWCCILTNHGTTLQRNHFGDTRTDSWLSAYTSRDTCSVCSICIFDCWHIGFIKRVHGIDIEDSTDGISTPNTCICIALMILFSLTKNLFK